MKRIGILTAGGDTPALNATIHGAVVRANQLRIEVIGLIKGFNSLFNPRVPHVHLNPLFQEIPELDPTKGGTLIGSSRDYVDPRQQGRARHRDRPAAEARASKDSSASVATARSTGLQPLAERLPTVLAPKTIDNDLGLNYPSEPDEWVRVKDPAAHGRCTGTAARSRSAVFDLDQIVNYVTPGYATAVFVSAQRRRAHPHHGRKPSAHRHHRGDGPPLRLHRARLRVRAARHRPRARASASTSISSSNGSGTSTTCRRTSSSSAAKASSTSRASSWARSRTLHRSGRQHRAERRRRGAARRMIQMLGDGYFQRYRRGESAREAIFTRKVGHTQRGGRPILFDRFYAAQLGAKAVDLLVEGRNNAVSVLQYHRRQGLLRRGLRRQPLPRSVGPASTRAGCTRRSTTRSS